jgi:hypothetical protein
MKKVFMSMTAAAMLSLVACGGGNKSADSTKETGEKAPKTETKASSGKFDEYKKLVEEATPLIEKMAKGDAEATKKYTEISAKIGEIAVEVQKELENSPEKLKQFQEITEKYAQEVQKAMMQSMPK